MSIRNMFESIMSEEDGGPAGNEAAGGEAGGGLMAEEPSETGATEADATDGAAESAGDGDEGDLAGLGGLEEGDDLGGFDDEGFGEMDDGDESVAELEHRLDELENEVGSLSSTVNTVRNENEQISESVGEVEENVRKLLDIYEMVTRGVNPFADDVDAGMAGGGMGDEGFGLFAEQEGAPSDDELDSDVAEADAEGFFEDDLVEDEDASGDDVELPDRTEDPDPAADVDEFEEFEEDGPPDDADGESDAADGTSFEDLKAEYEESEDDWADAEGFEDETLDDDELAAAGAMAEDDGLLDAEAGGEGTAADDEDSAGTEAEPTDAGDATTEASSGDGVAEDGGGEGPTTGPSKPYLAELPGGVGTDLIVVEWLEHLVGAAGVREAARAIDYYESIDWVDEGVADGLRDYLDGFEEGGGGSLTIDHHSTSLEYIGQLNGGGAETTALRRLAHGGGTDGVQR